MSPRTSLLARDFGSVVGLSTPLAIVLLIVVPALVTISTILLLIYYLRLRASKRDPSLSRNAKLTAERDQLEMALTSAEASFHPLTSRPYTAGSTVRPTTSGSTRPPTSGSGRPPTSGSLPPMEGFVTSTESSAKRVDPRNDRRVVAGHVKGAGSEVYDIQQYEKERARQQARDLILPSPTTTSPVRPKTAPGNSSSRSHFGYDEHPVNVPLSPLDYSRALTYEPSKSPLFSTSPTLTTSPSPTKLNTIKAHHRSSSLGRPSRPHQRPTHSPAPSILSVFPPKHVPRASITSPISNSSLTTPTPSPPLLPPAPQPPPKSKHSRHPSVDRNSLMPIAPIILPPEHLLPKLLEEQRVSSPIPEDGRSYLKRDRSRDNYI